MNYKLQKHKSMQNLQLPKAPEIKFFQSAEYVRRIEKAKHRMRAKPFIERFRTSNIIAMVGIFFFPTISVLTAIAFLFSYINGALNSFYVSIAISLILLSLIELTKNHLLNNGLDTYFSNSGKSMLTFLFALLFSIGSFIMSYQGAELLVIKLDKKKQQITDNTSNLILDNEKVFDKQISFEQNKIDDLQQKAKKQWQGLTTLEQNKLLLQYESNIEDLRKLKQNKVENIRNHYKNQLLESEASVGYNAYVFKVFAGINELLTILSIAFTAFYAYKTVREDIDLNDFKNQPEMYNSIEPAFQQSVSIENLPTKQSLNVSSERNVISGFFNHLDEEPRSPLNDERNRQRKCKFCNEEFDYKHWNKQYCSDDCRIANWEKKTGEKLNIKTK